MMVGLRSRGPDSASSPALADGPTRAPRKPPRPSTSSRCAPRSLTPSPSTRPRKPKSSVLSIQGSKRSEPTCAALRTTGDFTAAIRFGNLVAGITIMKKGTGTAEPEEVLAKAAVAWH